MYLKDTELAVKDGKGLLFVDIIYFLLVLDINMNIPFLVHYKLLVDWKDIMFFYLV